MKQKKKIGESKQSVQEENGPAVELHLGPGSLDANRRGGLHVRPDDDVKLAQMGLMFREGPELGSNGP